jgi:hypothetical protein
VKEGEFQILLEYFWRTAYGCRRFNSKLSKDFHVWPKLFLGFDKPYPSINGLIVFFFGIFILGIDNCITMRIAFL